MRALYYTSPKNTSAPSTLQSGVLSPTPSPLYRNAWPPVNYLLNRFVPHLLVIPLPFLKSSPLLTCPLIFSNLSLHLHQLSSYHSGMLVYWVLPTFVHFSNHIHYLHSLCQGLILGIEKFHAFYLLLCIITADSNFIISIPTQYIHLFPKFLLFFWLPIGQLHLGVSQLPQIKNDQNWTHHPFFNSLFCNKWCAYLFFIFPISNSPILHSKYFSNLFPQF